MITKCPDCGSILREKHYEVKVENGKEVKIVHLRCTGCKKYFEHKEQE